VVVKVVFARSEREVSSDDVVGEILFADKFLETRGFCDLLETRNHESATPVL
jgi:hypothetical protein